jgi:hypothetical protein
MLPVLIVCYLRPEKLDFLLQTYLGTARNVYVFIDRSDGDHYNVNKRVYEIAKKYIPHLNIKILWSEVNNGVGQGVPAAIDWAFGYETELIIIEDDCFPTGEAYHFFENQKVKLSEKNVMVAASSPWGTKSLHGNEFLTLSSYPLIWGWMTNVENWAVLRRLLNSNTPHLKIFKKMLLRPSRILPISYFYAAVIRVNRGRLKAWDSPVALEMLLSDLSCITSNLPLVENSGQDQFASHLFNPDGKLSEVVTKASSKSASLILDETVYWKRRTDKQIEEKIYFLKKRHLLSPIKAMIGL